MQIKDMLGTIICAIGICAYIKQGVFALPEEIYMYNENEQGYLFNVEAEGYLGIHPQGRSLGIFFTKNKKEAIKINIRPIREEYENYGLIASADIKDIRFCDNLYSITSDGTSKMLFGCPVLQINPKTTKMEIKRYRGQKNARFIFSPAVIDGLHAFRIYFRDNCLAARGQSVLSEPCEEIEPHKKKSQLFIWIKTPFSGK